MATEGPLLHDGGQCVAASNYGNAAGGGGNGGSYQFYGVALTGARTVSVAAAGQKIYGVLQNKPAAGDAADVGFLGPSKALAGGTITAGQDVMTNAAGLFVPWTTGNSKSGMAMESAVVGQVFTMFVYGPGSPSA